MLIDMATVEPSVVEGEGGTDNSVVTEVDSVAARVLSMVTEMVAADDPVVTEVDPVVAAADSVVTEVLSAVSDGDFVASDVDSDTSTSAEFTQPDPIPKFVAVTVKAPLHWWQPDRKAPPPYHLERKWATLGVRHGPPHLVVTVAPGPLVATRGDSASPADYPEVAMHGGLPPATVPYPKLVTVPPPATVPYPKLSTVPPKAPPGLPPSRPSIANHDHCPPPWKAVSVHVPLGRLYPLISHHTNPWKASAATRGSGDEGR